MVLQLLGQVRPGCLLLNGGHMPYKAPLLGHGADPQDAAWLPEVLTGVEGEEWTLTSSSAALST
jgi:hypothetical protein